MAPDPATGNMSLYALILYDHLQVIQSPNINSLFKQVHQNVHIYPWILSQNSKDFKTYSEVNLPETKGHLYGRYLVK